MKREYNNRKYKRLVQEGILILAIAVSLFLLLALISYHTTDPGWSRTASGMHIANFGGYLGAWLADIYLSVFGYIAYVFPWMIVYSALLPLKNQDANNQLIFFLRTLGFMLVLLAGCGLATVFISSKLSFGAGGILGSLFASGMITILNPTGAKIMLVALFLSGVTLFTGLSWLRLLDNVGRMLFVTIDFIGSKLLKLETKPVPKKPFVLAEPLPVEETKKIEPVITRVTPIKPSVRAIKDRQVDLFQADLEDTLPSLNLLDSFEKTHDNTYTRQELEDMSRQVEMRLSDFGIEVQVVAVHPGPVVTRFELQLAAGTKVNRITALAKDLARSLSVLSVRIVEVIPGKSVVGLELPNANREIVRLREILSSQQYEQAHSPLVLALGKDISGNPVVVDLAKMPHLLVAGTTGSGKSVCINALLLSLLYKYTPEQLRLIMIDPKMLELSVYGGIAHLLTPVVTDMKEAANALRWCVAEMERRYKLMVNLGVRNISGYNTKVREAIEKGAPLLDPLWREAAGETPEELQELPYIVVIADEFADMIMVVGKKVEELIARISQKARAAGIHLILATQRPSVDVVTGLIKANIPTRIAFQVSSKIDSRTILDQSGAEQLLGFGDMLYLPPGSGVPVRIHGAFVADEEVHRVVRDIKGRRQPEYLDEILDDGIETIESEDLMDIEQDPLYDQAVRIVTETRRASVSNIQRRLKIGYNRAARIVEAMEVAGIVSAMETNGNREVLAPPPPED